MSARRHLKFYLKVVRISRKREFHFGTTSLCHLPGSPTSSDLRASASLRYPYSFFPQLPHARIALLSHLCYLI